MAKRNKKVGQCALCGETHPITREHVPPKNLFLAPRPRNTITVPVCESCNHGYHLDDEYFRAYVAAGAQPGTRHWRLWTEKVVGSSFARSGGFKGRLNDDHAKVVRHHAVEPLRTFANQVVPNELLSRIQPFAVSRINAVVTKIVRCLHFSLTSAPLSHTARIEVDVSPLDDADLHALFAQRTGCVGEHDEFVFRREQLDASSFRWLLMFYEHHTFTVYVYTS